jgi:ATP-dependent helicase Lhr and Lhr-like helicase
MLARFHPAVASWFRKRFDAPTEPQCRAWPEIAAGRDTLVAAPTGSGKTLAAFMSAIDALVREGACGVLPDETRVLYVSPLRALAGDIETNLQTPCRGIAAELAERGLPSVEIRTAVRTGDTSPAVRARTLRQPPHILVTTPESLYILLTSAGGRRMLATVRTVIVDEIHALVGDKRGSHLALSLERLDDLCRRRGTGKPVRIGLSATQRPIEEVARFLVGTPRVSEGTPRCRIVDTGHARALDLSIEVPPTPLETVMSGETWEDVYDRIAALVTEHRTTLVFVNTRRLAERIARHLADRLGAETVAAHHGSLARQVRQRAETRLRTGELRALVATASLELGIDIGTVDLVCQIGSPRSIAALLQRIGRSGHAMGEISRGRLFPTNRDELVEAAALLDAVNRGELDRLVVPEAPIDILAQQLVAACADESWSEDALFELVRGAWPYRHLPRERFDRVIEMLSDGFATRRGRRSAHLHRDGVNRRVRGRRGARLVATTSGGAIPDLADYDVVLEPEGTIIGTLNEDFAIESMAGDIVQLGNASWRILRVESGRVRVADAHGQPPNIPFWLGEAPGRTHELSAAVCRLRKAVAQHWNGGGTEGCVAWLSDPLGLQRSAAEQLCEYLASAHQALGAMPSMDTLVLERFFDEAGGMQLVLHAPFGTRVNRAWGLALRKRFCQRFDFELQAAATDDAIVLSLGPVHSFPLHEVFAYLRSQTVRDLLVQALLDAPMFAARWRWNVGRALAVPRFAGGKKVPPQLQRMRADDLLTVVFPDQVACFENLSGPREIPDHPLVQQTIDDCLHEAMDVERFLAILRSLEAGELELVARDLPEPSPLAAAVLSARPWAFLDDAPLEERRTRAVVTRRWLDPRKAIDLGALDAAVIDEVARSAWPRADDADELHDALMVLGVLRDDEVARGRTRDGRTWLELASELAALGRAFRLERPPDPTRAGGLWVATERRSLVFAALGGPTSTECHRACAPEAGEAHTALVRGRLECTGPTTVERLAERLTITVDAVDAALQALEADGLVLRGHFTPGAEALQWCERSLLARIHRRTVDRLRAEIRPVSSADFLRFLAQWQHVSPEHRVEGPEGLAGVLAQLEGFEAAAGAWERSILPARVHHYDPGWLDQLCLSGRWSWLRLRPGAATRRGPMQSTPITFVPRADLPHWCSTGAYEDVRLSPDARRVGETLARRGASFVGDLTVATGFEPFRIEDGLAELVAQGLATCDGFAGLRSLLAARSGGTSVGRWSLLPAKATEDRQTEREHVARTLLRRYGVVVRRLLERERAAPSWLELVRVYRTLEARGEIRGGRFVDGCAGEQFALPEAVAMLREVRRTPGSATLAIDATDPLNLAGILQPGPRVPARIGTSVVLRDGVMTLQEDVRPRPETEPRAETREESEIAVRA